MTWTLLIVIGAGSIISTSANIYSVPMKDRAACIEAANNFAAESKGVGITCLSSETGELVRVAPKR